MYTRTHALAVTTPFQFAHSLRFLCGFSPMAGEQTVRAGVLEKAFRIGGQTVAVEVHEAGPGSLSLAAHSERPRSAELEAAVIDRVRFFLSLDDLLMPFYERADRDPKMRPIVAALYGYHQVKLATPFENTCWAILAQRCPIPLARKIKDALTAAAGGTLGSARAFPSAEDLLAAPAAAVEAALAPAGATKLARIRAAAERFAAVDERFLRHGPSAEVDAWLRSLEGVGPWSAAFIKLRGLGRTDDLSGAEQQLLTSIRAVYGEREVATLRDLSRLAAEYGPYQGWWSLYVRTFSEQGMRATVRNAA
ncbi:MAG: hypothetical protein U1E65_02770 [Myxococcota bacterium]